MKFFVYILYSNSHNKSYVGFTSNMDERLIFHNNSENKKSYTYDFRPWIVIYTEEFETIEKAMLREKWFKSGVGRELKAKIISDYLKSK
jgi:putative endonuclease